MASRSDGATIDVMNHHWISSTLNKSLLRSLPTDVERGRLGLAEDQQFLSTLRSEPGYGRLMKHVRNSHVGDDEEIKFVFVC